jgi:hypothetical protein
VHRLLVIALLALVPAADAGAAWAPPVSGAPARLFDLGANPFARGQHRGVDLGAARGERVASACPGVVVFAGRVAGVGTVSVRCGGWRVSYAPLEAIAVRAHGRVGEGRRLGRVGHAAGHVGLHLGVRREGRRFGYVDPLRFFAAARRAPPPLLPVRPVRLPRPAPRARPAAHPVRAASTLAPWPVWLGLVLLMTGLAGAGTLRFPFRRQEGASCRASSTSSSSRTTPSSP